MTLTIDGTDFTSRVIDSGSEHGGSISDAFGLIAKEKQYILRDYDNYLNPHYSTGYFARTNWRGKEVVETDNSGLVTFRGTIENLKVTDDSRLVIIASEPMTILLDFVVELTDKTTYAGYLVNGFTAKNSTTIQIDTGTVSIPVNSTIYFADTKNPSYSVISVSPSSGATKTITIDRQLELDVADNTAITVSAPITTTAPAALKSALLTSNPDILLDGSFDQISASDLSNGYTFIFNIKEQDDITLRDFISQVCDMSCLYLFQKTSGHYYIRRGLNYDNSGIGKTLSGAEITPNIEPDFDSSNLIIGYQNIYYSASNQVGLATEEVPSATIEKYKGTRYWNPIQVQNDFLSYKILYSSQTSAEYFGNFRLDYFYKPRQVLQCTAKKSYNIDATQLLNLALGDQCFVTVRGFNNIPMIVVDYLYSEESLNYKRLVLQRND